MKETYIVNLLYLFFLNVNPLQAQEAPTYLSGAEGNGEVKLNADWLSDHWAVSAEFELN